MIRFDCCDERRRAAVAGRSGLDGIDWLEVVDTDDHPLGPPLQTLVVRFINGSPPPLSAANVAIVAPAGAQRVGVSTAAVRGAEPGVLDGPALVIRTDRPGDFSLYELRLVTGPGKPLPPPGLDPILSVIDFGFRVGCDDAFDTAPSRPCPPERVQPPPIDYLARDYASLRQVLLDRVALLSPAAGTAPADLPAVLVELLAYVGDRLSYRQDAVATEATLDTARRRISARRHARLVDYPMHDGCNARAWVEIAVAATLTVPAGTPLLTRSEGVPALVQPGSDAWFRALGRGAQVFETTAAATLRPELNAIDLHDWGGRCCRLPKGATAATLLGDLSGLLAPGDVLVLREVRGVDTGAEADADPTRRWAVRLTAVESGSDPLGGAFLPEPDDLPRAVTEIAWDVADALPFALTLSARPGRPGAPAYVDGIARAFGNVVLVDHGLTGTEPEALGTVPEPRLPRLAAQRPVDSLVEEADAAACAAPPTAVPPPRFAPTLRDGPLTMAAPIAAISARAMLAGDPGRARPAVALWSTDADGSRTDWQPAVPDLIGAGADPLFVVECDNDLRGRLRFGDGVAGLRPQPGAAFFASYRIGNGQAGNVGAGAIAHVALAQAQAARPAPFNPMPATGGVDPETVEEVRRRAPFAFRRQRRAVTPGDYADQAALLPGVQRAAATLGWTGSWRTHQVAIDPVGGETLGAGRRAELEGALEPVRLAGHDVLVVQPVYAPLEVAVTVRVAPGTFRSAVRQSLADRLTAGLDPSGRPGLFHPDRFTFGQPAYASPMLALIQHTAGVASVQLDRFQRLRRPDTDGRRSGRIAIGSHEIAQLDNDPDHPDRGMLTLTLEGGE